MILVAVCVVAWLLVLLFVLALCAAAADADRRMDRWQ